jgi:hypothetical protein
MAVLEKIRRDRKEKIPVRNILSFYNVFGGKAFLRRSVVFKKLKEEN